MPLLPDGRLSSQPLGCNDTGGWGNNCSAIVYRIDYPSCMLCMSRYAPTLEDMYTQMEQRQKERQSAMRDAAAQGSISDKVKQVRAHSEP